MNQPLNNKEISTTINCPTCRKALPWNDDYPERPFCSPRCRNSDFVEWANENHRISGEPGYDEQSNDSDI